MSTPPIVTKFEHPEDAPAALEEAIDALKNYGLKNLAAHLEQVRANAALGSFGRTAMIDAIVTARLHIGDTMFAFDLAKCGPWATGLGRVLPLLDGATRRLRKATR